MYSTSSDRLGKKGQRDACFVSCDTLLTGSLATAFIEKGQEESHC